MHVLDIPKYYTTLKNFLDKSNEDTISSFMTGEEIPFNSDYVKKDDVWLALVSPSSHDGHMLLSIFRAFGLLLERVLTDLSPVMQAEAENSDKVHIETESVPSTNTVSERDFAKFDRLIQDKPNASTLALEAHILFTNNKTSTWFRQKFDAERAKRQEVMHPISEQHTDRGFWKLNTKT